MLESNAYKTYYVFASGEKALKLKYIRKKDDPDTSPKQKPVQATKGTRIKTKAKLDKSDKKKQPAKKPKAKGLAVLSKVAVSEAEQLKLATKRSKIQFHSSHTSGSGDGVEIQSKVPDDEKKFWGNSEDEDKDDKNDYDDLSDEGDDDNDGNDGNEGDDDDANDDDKQEGDDTNDDYKETDSDRTESDKNKTNEEHNKEEEEYDDEFNIEEDEKMDEEEDDEVTKELYIDVNINLGNKDANMTDADQGGTDQQNVYQQSGFEQEDEDAHVTLTPVLDTQRTEGPTQSSSISSDFTSKLLNLDNLSPVDNEIASLMDTTTQHATTIPETTSSFTTSVPTPPPFFSPLQQEATPTPTPITSETTTSLPTLLYFASVFKFNERVTNLEKDLSKMKQVDQYAQALSSIPAIVDQEAQAEKREYIELVDSMVKTIIKDEVNAQLPQILPQAFSDVATSVINKNITKSVEAAVLTRSSSQPMSTYKVTASLSEFELTKILIDKIEKNKSYDKAYYKKKLYDALVESYNTDKDLFDSYGKVFSLKRSRDERDKDRDPSAGSDRRTKRRKSSKHVESSQDSRSKDKKSSSTFKKASKSQHKSFGKSAHAKEPSHTIEDSGMQQDQEFMMRDNDEQPADKETWISQVERAKEPTTSFDELNDTSFDFFAFVMNQLKILNLTQEILVGPAFNPLKGTCKSIIEVEYHLEECSKATTERLDWHNPKNKPYPFDLRKPLPLIQDHRGCQIIPQDYFINKDLEYLKGGDLIRRYSTSVTKTKAASYDLKWIEDLVPNL
ncbi:hypothetical protein Tco_1021233 [Tanacetum coccineum]